MRAWEIVGEVALGTVLVIGFMAVIDSLITLIASVVGAAVTLILKRTERLFEVGLTLGALANLTGAIAAITNEISKFSWIRFVAVGNRVAPVPPRRSRRAAFPHRAPIEG